MVCEISGPHDSFSLWSLVRNQGGFSLCAANDECNRGENARKKEKGKENEKRRE